jgi:hypothetical protein
MKLQDLSGHRNTLHRQEFLNTTDMVPSLGLISKLMILETLFYIRGQDSVATQLVTGWTVWGLNPRRGKRFSCFQSHPASYSVGTGVLSWC